MRLLKHGIYGFRLGVTRHLDAFSFSFLSFPESTARKSVCRDRCNRESFLLVWEWLMSLNTAVYYTICIFYHVIYWQ
jgi:hypothetical protein